MMDAPLQDLMEQDGIHAALVFDGAGQLVAHRGHAIYDASLLQNVSNLVVKAIDSVELLHEDWDSMQARFSDGLLMLRNLGTTPHYEGRLVLAVVADTSLNRSFATVAMRVVVQKLRQNLARPPPVAAPPPLPPPLPSAPSVSVAASGLRSGIASPVRPGAMDWTSPPGNGLGSGFQDPNVASGLSWSGGGTGQSSAVWVADEPAHALLDRMTKVLAHYVGPMAKIFIKEAVREVCGSSPFSDTQAGEVRERVAQRVDNPKDRSEFLKHLRGLPRMDG